MSKFDPNATPECDEFGWTAKNAGGEDVQVVGLWRANRLERKMRCFEEKLRIAVEALMKIEDANGMWVTSFAEETLKRIEEVGREAKSL